jgi:hypothetical protein
MEKLRTLAEVAADLHISTKTLRRRIREAGIAPARPSRAPLLSDADVMVVLEASRARNTTPPDRSTAAPPTRSLPALPPTPRPNTRRVHWQKSPRNSASVPIRSAAGSTKRASDQRGLDAGRS